jgi:hypothetical protein
MPILPFAEWLPDQPAGEGSSLIRNVIPRSKSSYAPMPGLAPVSEALPERCFGAIAQMAPDRQSWAFAAGATTISRYQTSGAWDDVSVAGGYNPGAFEEGGGWDATLFGGRVVMTNYIDPPQSYLIGSSTDFANLAAAAPKARYCRVVKDFLMLGATNDPVDGERPRRVWWSAIGDPADWPTPGSDLAVQRQSDFQDLEQAELGHLRGLSAGNFSGADAAAFFEYGIVRIAYVGSPAIFQFDVAEGASGTNSPWSIVERRLPTPAGMRAVAYYLGEEGFYAFDGQASVPIGAGKFDKSFYRDLETTYRGKVLGVADPYSKCVFWAYHGKGGGGASLYNRLLVYNWELGRASLCELDPVEWVTRTLTSQLTLDDLDPFGNLEVLTPSLDSIAWIKDSPGLAMFDSNHRLGRLTGPNLAAVVETAEGGPDGRRGKMFGTARPILEGHGGDSATIAVGHRERKTAPVVYDAEVPVNLLGCCGLRSTGRYLRLRLSLPAGAVFDHLAGIEAALRPEGRLR